MNLSQNQVNSSAIRFKGSGGKFNQLLRKPTELWTSQLTMKQICISSLRELFPLPLVFESPTSLSDRFYCIVLENWSLVQDLSLLFKSQRTRLTPSLFSLLQDSYHRKPTENFCLPVMSQEKKLRSGLKPMFTVTLSEDPGRVLSIEPPFFGPQFLQ